MTAWDGLSERRMTPTHCQQEILDRLTKIEVEFALQRDMVKDIHSALRGGNGDGLLIRHDRVERVVQTMCWALGVTVAAVITMLVKQWMG